VHQCFIRYSSDRRCIVFGANCSVLVDPNPSLVGSAITIKEMLYYNNTLNI
jgi:hypothetical protein